MLITILPNSSMIPEKSFANVNVNDKLTLLLLLSFLQRINFSLFKKRKEIIIISSYPIVKEILKLSKEVNNTKNFIFSCTFFDWPRKDIVASLEMQQIAGHVSDQECLYLLIC